MCREVYRPCHEEILGIPYEEKTEFVSILKVFNFVQLRNFRVEIKQYLADGGKELISKEVL